MKTSILCAVILALAAGQGQATIIAVSSGLFERYAVSASDIVGSGYIRFYGPTNQDYNAIFTGWLIAESAAGDSLLDSSYPAYDSIEALDLEGKAKASDQIQPDLADMEQDSYTLLLAYAITPVCIGDTHSAVCGDPGKDIKITVSSTVKSGS